MYIYTHTRAGNLQTTSAKLRSIIVPVVTSHNQPVNNSCMYVTVADFWQHREKEGSVQVIKDNRSLT